MNFPFAGIIDRPYDNMLLTKIDWRSIEIEWFRYSEIWLTQSHLKIRGMFNEKYSTDQFPHLVQYQNRLYLEDGHHRTIRRALLGQTDGAMRLFDWKLLDENGN